MVPCNDSNGSNTSSPLRPYLTKVGYKPGKLEILGAV